MTITSTPNAPIFYTYALLDPRKKGPHVYGDIELPYEPFYVGKGKGDRARAHRLRSNPAVKNKIAKIERETGKPHIVHMLISDVIETSAYEIEERAINTVGRKDLGKGPLLNRVNGGPGKQQMFVSSKTRKRRAASVQESWARLTHEEYELRTANMKVAKSEGHKAKLSESKKRLYAGEAGAKVRATLAASARAAAKRRTPKETERIYAKQRRTRELNKWFKAFFGYVTN